MWVCESHFLKGLSTSCIFYSSEGIKPPSDVETVKLDDVLPQLQTGDLVLMTGATTGGAIIKLFDDSEFTHVAIVSILRFFIKGMQVMFFGYRLSGLNIQTQ